MKKIFLPLMAVALFGAGCWGPQAANNDPDWIEPTKPEGIAGEVMGNWKIRSMKVAGESSKDVADLLLLVGFDGTKMNGKVCNSMSGDYMVSGIVLKAPMVISTKMFCEGDAGKAETAFTSGLSTGFEVTKEADGSLKLVNGQTTLVLERQ